jgi:fatty-acyl-CoA synthase
VSWLSFLDSFASKSPYKRALIDQRTRRELSYRELRNEVLAWAQILREEGVREGNPVAFLATNDIHHIILLLACAQIGAIFTPLNFRLSAKELGEIVDEIEPALFLGVGQWEVATQTKYRDLRELDKNRQILENTVCVIDEERPVLMLFTSGTTGTPKGVLFSGRMLASNQLETCRGWGLRPTDVTLIETPFFHTGGYNVLCLPLLSIGGSVVIAQKFDVNNVLTSIPRYGISVYFGVPTMFQMMLEHPRFLGANFESIRFFVSGGAPCPVELMTAFQERQVMFKQGFGLTEVGPNCFLLPEREAMRKVGSIGQAMPHSEVLLLTEEGRPAQMGEIGELLIKGPHLCSGYFKREEQFHASLFDGYFKTGDLARVDDEGFYFIVGRKKDMYISGGENVYPAEVEKRINAHPDILESVVVSVPHLKWGEVGHAFIRAKRSIELNELRDFLGLQLSRYKQPHELTVLESFPLLASGKIDRNSLKESLL